MAKEEKDDFLDVEATALSDAGLLDETITGPDFSAKPQTEDAKAAAEADKKKAEATQPDKSQTWDADRQKRDQDHANERKAWESQLADVQAERRATQAKLDQILEAQSKPKESSDLDENLTEDTEYGELIKRHSAAVKKVKDQDARIAKLESKLNTVSAAIEHSEAAAGEQELIGRLATEFGAEYQNQAQELARAELTRRGYSANKPPSLDLLDLTMRVAFSFLANKARSEKSGRKVDESSSITLDSGKGGHAPQSTRFEGTIDEVLADISKHGVG